MSEIVQQLGFEAQSAISSLKSLDGALANLETRLQSTAAALKGFNSAAAPATAALAKFGSMTQTAANTAASSLNNLNTATTRFTTSFALLSRIVFTQTVIKGMRLIEQGAAGAARGFVAFEKGLSEIQALDPSASLDQLQKSARQLSDTFNVSLGEVVEAQKDLVGSGFSAADSNKVFAESAKLARLGAASQSEATDLLITSLRSYGASAEQANEHARILFSASDKGRITIRELAANFAKAAPAMRAVGASVNEVSAGFATLTQLGVSAPQAATGLANIATAFIKPSEAMIEALKTLNVESGQALIAQRGLSGAIRAVIGTTDGSAQAIATLFRTQQALRPVLLLNSDSFRTFNQHLAATQSLSQRDFELRFLRRTSTDSEVATKALNQFKNAAVVGLGGGLLETASAAARLTGNMNALTNITTSFFRVITGNGLKDFAKTLDALAKHKGLESIHESTAKTNEELTKLAAKHEAIIKAAQRDPAQLQGFANVDELKKSLDQAFDNKVAENFKNTIQQTLTLAKEAAAGLNNVRLDNAIAFLERLAEQGEVTELELLAAAKALKSIDEAGSERNVQATSTGIRDVNAEAHDQAIGRGQGAITLLRERSKLFDKEKKDLAQSTANANNLNGALTRGAQTLGNMKNEAERLKNVLADSAARVQSLQQKQSEQQFNLGIVNLDDAQKSFALTQRSAQLASQAADKLTNAAKSGDAEQIKQALAQFQTAENVGQQAQQLAQRVNSRVAEARAMQTLKENTDRQISAEQQLQSITQQKLTPAQQAEQSAQNLNVLLQQGTLTTQQMSLAAQTLTAAGLQPAEFAVQGVNFGMQGALMATNQAIGAAAALAAQYQLAASAAASIQPPAAPTTAPATAQFGRYFAPSYFANGGRGTDTIPAMLSAGEMVINARSVREFFPQLQAMNAGMQPVFRENGGTVTNVGDINVSVTGGSSSRQTLKEIANGINRNIRTGSFRFLPPPNHGRRHI